MKIIQNWLPRSSELKSFIIRIGSGSTIATSAILMPYPTPCFFFKAGVKRIVHVSITNPSEESELEYFSGKAKLEKALIESGIGYSILRPAVLFGNEDILVNNIAWMLRHLPVFGIFGDGEYKLQPIHVQDFAELAVKEGKGSENKIIDAIGPETFSYRELVKTISEILGVRRTTVSVPPSIGYACGVIAGWMLGDKVITKDEIKGLMKGLLATNSDPVGTTSLTEWAKRNSNQFMQANWQDGMIEPRHTRTCNITYYINDAGYAL